MRTVDLVKWRGEREPEILDPDTMSFRAQPAKGKGDKSCAGCVFDKQWGKVCKRVGELAKAAGIEDCDKGFVYVTSDPRQLSLVP